MPMKQELTTEQLRAIREFASQHGRTWKSQLRECWMTGQYPPDCDSRSLQNIRNSFGPIWLVNFRMPKDSFHHLTEAVKELQWFDKVTAKVRS